MEPFRLLMRPKLSATVNGKLITNTSPSFTAPAAPANTDPVPPPTPLVPVVLIQSGMSDAWIEVTFSVPVTVVGVPTVVANIAEGSEATAAALIGPMIVRYEFNTAMPGTGNITFGADDPAVEGLNGARVAAGVYPYTL